MEMSEEEYRHGLECERKLYAWCLERWGGCSAEDAEQRAAQFYCYKPPDARSRVLVFHRPAWDWAMFHIHGDGYWRTRPELAQPPAEYDREYERIYGTTLT